MEQVNVPQLRFDGFDGEWESVKFQDICTIRSGHGFKASEYVNEGIPLVKIDNVGYEELKRNNISYLPPNYYEQYPELRLKTNDIVLALNRPITNGRLKISLVSKDFSPSILYQRVGKIDIKNTDVHDKSFVFSLLRKRIYEFVQGNSVGSDQPFISTEKLKMYGLKLPGIEEQKKIGHLLKLVSLKIEKQQEKIEKLEQFKKGMMQKIFSQELRFKDEDGGEFPEWEESVRAKGLFKNISNKNHLGDLPVLSASQENGIVLRDSNNIQIQFSVDNLVNYKKVEPNDFVISLRSFQGGIEFSQILGIMSPAYTIFRAFDLEKIYPPYFSFLFKTTDFITRLNNLTYGIRDGKAISFTDFSTMTFNVPSLQEQKKVADYLGKIDKKIDKEKEKLMVLEEQKRGFMWGMFV